MHPQTNLSPGQTGQEVAKLQQFLRQQGLLSDSDIATGPGIYGPRTTAAVKSWQRANGVDNSSGPGHWGPRSIQVASGRGNQRETQESVDSQYAEVASRNPKVASLINNGDTIESVISALQNGDLSTITDSFGMPFDVETQQKAIEDSNANTRAYFKALEDRETADTESALAQKQADYQNYLLNSGQQFEVDKTKADQNAANSGVLFSGGRVQKEKNLERTYQQDQDRQFGNTSRDISSIGQDFQYKYGKSNTNQFKNSFNLGGNTFNANTARGGVGSSELSKIYNPGNFNSFKGTRLGEKSAIENTRAASRLQNRGNKLLATGRYNQFN